MKVAVGSQNIVKINACKTAFKKVWPKTTWSFAAIEVKSSVSKQPMTDEESIKGAINRAEKAIKLLKADFGVGLEGGMQQIGDKWYDCGWIAVIDKHNHIGIGSSLKILVPEKMVNLIKQGKELGEVTDIVFKGKNLKQKNGHFGCMTNNAITRTSGYVDGIISSLARFIHPELFE